MHTSPFLNSPKIFWPITLLSFVQMAIEFIQVRNIFLIRLFKGREILEVSNIFIENSISLRRSIGVSLTPGSCKSLANGHRGGEWTKSSALFFEIQHHVVASVYACLTPFRPVCGIHSLKVSPSLLSQISTDRLQAFRFKLFSVETCSGQK